MTFRIVNLVGVWTGIGRFDDVARQAASPAHFRYRLEGGRIVELWTKKSNYQFVLGKWIKLNIVCLTFWGLATLRFISMSRKGLDYRVDSAR